MSTREGVQKRVGLVVDFVGVLRELKKALQFDSADVSGVIEDLDLLLKDFLDKIAKAEDGLPRCRRRRRAPTNDSRRVVYGRFLDPEARKAFFEAYKDIEALWEILSPSPELRDHIDDLQAARAALRGRAERLCRQGRLRRRSRLQDAAAGRGKRDAGRARPPHQEP